MILQALTEYYQSLVQAEKIAAPGWKSSDISFVLCISDEGELEQVISIKNQVSQGKKTVLRPQSMILPVPADGRTSTAVRPNFLWDKSDYLLGISKGGTQRGIKYFNGAKEYHEAILSGVVSPAATALLAFFQQWDPEKLLNILRFKMPWRTYSRARTWYSAIAAVTSTKIQRLGMHGRGTMQTRAQG